MPHAMQRGQKIKEKKKDALKTYSLWEAFPLTHCTTTSPKPALLLFLSQTLNTLKKIFPVSMSNTAYIDRYTLLKQKLFGVYNYFKECKGFLKLYSLRITGIFCTGYYNITLNHNYKIYPSHSRYYFLVLKHMKSPIN